MSVHSTEEIRERIQNEFDYDVSDGLLDDIEQFISDSDYCEDLDQFVSLVKEELENQDDDDSDNENVLYKAPPIVGALYTVTSII